MTEWQPSPELAQAAIDADDTPTVRFPWGLVGLALWACSALVAVAAGWSVWASACEIIGGVR